MQDSPNTIKIELTEGCTLACGFCGINGIREKPGGFKFLSLDKARHIAKLLQRAIKEDGWNPRIEMAMRGEPSMNPNKVEIVQLIRAAHPKGHIQMTSNGTGLLRSPGPAQNIEGLFQAGLNVLILDNYDGINSVTKIMEGVTRKFNHYPADPTMNPYRKRRHFEQDIVVLPDISKTDTGVHSKHELCNHGGAAGPKDYSRKHDKCVKPFREFVIRQDGFVPACCDAWLGFFNFGNVMDVDNFQTIWQSENMSALRRLLYRGQRTIGDCDGCNSRSTRVGLLPDKIGQGYLSLPTVADEDRLIALAKLGPLTPPVKRAWFTGLTVKGKAV